MTFPSRVIFLDTETKGSASLLDIKQFLSPEEYKLRVKLPGSDESRERTVDLVTFDHHELAKRAKDAGAALVFLSLAMLAFIWALTLYKAFCL